MTVWLCNTKIGFVVRVLRHRVMKTYDGVEIKLRAFLNWELDKDKWSASHSGRFTSGIHRVRGLVGTRVSLDAVARRRITAPPAKLFIKLPYSAKKHDFLYCIRRREANRLKILFTWFSTRYSSNAMQHYNNARCCYARFFHSKYTNNHSSDTQFIGCQNCCRLTNNNISIFFFSRTGHTSCNRWLIRAVTLILPSGAWKINYVA